jgi:hypothetical protein
MAATDAADTLALQQEAPTLSWWEYQALMLCLAATMCLGLVAIELTMRRFQVLSLLFPGMFSIRERRLYFFDFDVDDVAIGKRLRAEAKLMVRIVLFVVLSYLWQHCVLDTDQMFGKEFPSEQCDRSMACFSSELDVATFFSRAYEPVDCTVPAADRKDFEKRVVVSCMIFVKPSASLWLMHLGIAHSITQLNFKSYEVVVWICGNSRWVRRSIAVLSVVSFLAFLILFFVGYVTTFTTTWLEVLTGFYIPVYLNSVWKTGRILKNLWRREAQKVQVSIETHLNEALADFQEDGTAVVELDSDIANGQESPARRRHGTGYLRGSGRLTQGAKNLLRSVVEMPNNISSMLSETSAGGPTSSWTFRRRSELPSSKDPSASSGGGVNAAGESDPDPMDPESRSATA